MKALLFVISTLLPCIAQRAPDLDAQRVAMKKLEFLVGKWSGEARIFRLPTEPVVLVQTEDAYYKLDGLILLIEGVGRKLDGAPALQALGVISYDDETESYKMRAFNDGRFTETQVKLIDRGITWGFTVGQYRTSSVMRINDKGDWTELHDITIGTQAPRKYMELTVSRQK
jgi:hypothetical protein